VTHPEVALLAPVPLEHLKSAYEHFPRGHKIAFGSRAFDVFHEMDNLRKGRAAEVYLYASHSGEMGRPCVTWRARYTGYVDSVDGAHPRDMEFRPPSTLKYPGDNSGYWALFWEVEGLEPLNGASIPIARLRGYRKKGFYKPTFVPEGPLLIERPSVGASGGR
jgi:hypothetical protein